MLCVEVDAVGDSNKHVAVCDPVALGHAHPDAVASWVDHGLEVTGGVDPVIDGALGGISCAGEHGEVGSEAIRVASVNSGLALLRSVMPGVAPVGADLGGIRLALYYLFTDIAENNRNIIPSTILHCHLCKQLNNFYGGQRPRHNLLNLRYRNHIA